MHDHPKVAKIYGLCPQTGCIIMELCEKKIGDQKVHTLEDLMVIYGDRMPLDLKVIALTDIIESIEFLHNNGLIHGNVKPSNVLVNGMEDDEFVFKLTNYACTPISKQQSSHSTTPKQLMTPGYMAPELLPNHSTNVLPVRPNKASDIYVFAILSYEVVCCKSAWSNVSMTLIDSVQNGFQPSFPPNVDTTLSSLIKECWLHDPESWPIATAILQILDNYFETLQKDKQACPLPEDVCTQQAGDNQIIMCNEPDTYLDGNDGNCNTAASTDSCSQSSSEINQSQSIFQNAVASDFPFNPQISSQQSGNSIITQLEMLKSKLKVTQYKTFQLATIESLQDGKDTIVVQPTGSVNPSVT